MSSYNRNRKDDSNKLVKRSTKKIRKNAKPPKTAIKPGHLNLYPLRKSGLPITFEEFVRNTNIIEVTKDIIRRTTSPKVASKCLKDEKHIRYKAYSIYNSYMHSDQIQKPPFCCLRLIKDKLKSSFSINSNIHDCHADSSFWTA